jgi:hypothetical protein
MMTYNEILRFHCLEAGTAKIYNMRKSRQLDFTFLLIMRRSKAITKEYSLMEYEVSFYIPFTLVFHLNTYPTSCLY